MTLRLVRSPSNDRLWETCVQRFLDELQGHTGPAGHAAWLWLTHRLQRNALFEEAASRNLKGWLHPPIVFLSQLPDLFDLKVKPVALLRRRNLIGSLAASQAQGLESPWRTTGDGRGLGQAVDRLFGELLPEGITPDELAVALVDATEEEFAATRNDWVVAVYRDYLDLLRERGLYDWRSIHALVADKIREGYLPTALNGAESLHVYGLTSLRHRRRLMEALRDQGDVEVTVYLPGLPEDLRSEWQSLGVPIETIPGEPGASAIKPAPDARRELEWVAARIKGLLVGKKVKPHQIAVVARTGRDDTRQVHELLDRAGIPNTARIRTPFAQIPALRAILNLFRGAALGWPYRPLRHVLESAYFDIDVDLSSIDYIAWNRRVEGLAAWGDQLEKLRDDVLAAESEAAEDDREKSDRGKGAHRKPRGLFGDRLAEDHRAFEAFAAEMAELEGDRPLEEWIELTMDLLKPGCFGFRPNVCRDHDGHFDIVRLDQQGVDRLRRLLDDWRAGVSPGEAVEVKAWYGELRRFLESNEIALSTPQELGVRILEAHEAALFPFQHTFVIHANDGEFPRRPPVPAIFSDEERAALAERGLPLAHRELMLHRERVLWHAVTNNPNVTITYRTADPQGTPLLPSLCVPKHEEEEAIARTRFTWEDPITLAQAEQRDAEVLAERKRKGQEGHIQVVHPASLRQAILAGYAEARRGAGPPGSDREAGELGPWNGHIRDEAVLAYLARKFGATRVWSVSQLESYSACPFHFLLERVLYLKEVAEAEEETSVLDFGSVAHAVLEKFYRACDGEYPSEFDARAEKIFERATQEAFAEAEDEAQAGRRWLGYPALWEITRRDISEKTRSFLEWELPKLEEDGYPVHFELAFGFHEDSPAEISGFDQHGVERTIKLRGRIDRVDEADGGAALHVLDYKSGNIPERKGYEDGGVLQAPVYMEALRSGRDLRPESGRYRSIKKPGEPKHESRVWVTDDVYEGVLRIALSIPGRIRAGRFEAKMAHSRLRSGKWPSYLPGREVCRTDAKFEKGESRFDD